MAATADPATGAPAPFVFPREYHFPPFFTRQVHSMTHRSQVEKWGGLVCAYCQHHGLYRLSLSSPATEDLFHNHTLGRRLALADAREVLEHLRRDGRAEWVTHGSASAWSAGLGSVGGLFGTTSAAAGEDDGTGDVVWIYWKTPDEWARELETWVDATGQKGTVLTLYELTEGEATLGTGTCSVLSPLFPSLASVPVENTLDR